MYNCIFQVGAKEEWVTMPKITLLVYVNSILRTKNTYSRILLYSIVILYLCMFVILFCFYFLKTLKNKIVIKFKSCNLLQTYCKLKI